MHSLPPISVILNFLVLVVGLVLLLKKPLGGFLASRSDEIKKNVEESERLHQEALGMLKQYQGKLDKLDGEIQSMLDFAKKEGEKEKQEILARAERMSNQIIENAKNMAERELLRQKDILQKELMLKVVADALVTLKEKTTEKEHQQFTSQFITQMEKLNGDIN